jgi:N6-adenosine-specific RNA methylase IME4/ParB-like chromosome segregation protein Spo0J
MKIQNKDIPVSKIKLPKKRLRQVSKDKVRELAESISQVGLLQPIVVDKSNSLVSGMHRLEAHKLLKIKNISVRVIDFNKFKKTLSEIDENLKRNELNEIEIGEHIVQREILLEHLGQRAKRGDNRFTDRREIDFTSTTDELGKEIGLSKRSYLYRKQIAVGLSEKVRTILKESGQSNNISALLELSKQPKLIQNKVSGLIKKGAARTIQSGLKTILDRNNIEQLCSNKKYSILYTDPPWEYGLTNRGGDGETTGSSKTHYPTLSIEKLKNWNVSEICNTNALLFMWITSPWLDQGIELGLSWGFEYKTIGFVWNKMIPVPGNYTLGQVELCLVFKRGSIPRPRGARNIRQYLEQMRTKHSEKPDEIRKRIEKMFPTQKKIELFARTKHRGWDVFGNELDIEVPLTAVRS